MRISRRKENYDGLRGKISVYADTGNSSVLQMRQTNVVVRDALGNSLPKVAHLAAVFAPYYHQSAMYPRRSAQLLR